MNINIKEIIDNKIKEMEENKLVEKLIEENIEIAITKGIEGALNSYTLKHQIEEKMEKEVSGIVNEIGFTAYNSFISEKVKQIAQNVCRQDIADKIQKTFDDILIVKRENIKLSEICEAYKEWLEDSLDYQEKYDLENFYASIEEEREYRWLTIVLALKEPSRSYSYSSDEYHVRFTVHRDYKNEKLGSIGSVRIEGNDINKTFELKRLSSFEAMIINLHYNETPIIIDIEDEDYIETYFSDID